MQANGNTAQLMTLHLTSKQSSILVVATIKQRVAVAKSL
jgi:hypothetical protein